MEQGGGSAEQTAGAEAAYASYLARVQRGEQVDFEAFCRERPDVADSLRTLHRAWAGRAEAPPPSRVQSIRDFLSQRQAPAEISLDPEAPQDPPSSGVRERLSLLATRSGRYTLRGEVARGGMGVILKVWDRDLRRTLAMKAAFGSVEQMEKGGAASADVENVARFLEEAQITGQLDHPGIVPVHELGVDDEGRMFFTMRLVKGQTFDEVIRLARADEDGWNRPRALNAMVRVCEAMAYAHSKGVIHRDIKPANVMVGKFGEVYVMDWGLAKVIGRDDPHGQRMNASVLLMRTQVLTDRAEDLGRTPHSPLVTMEGTIIGTPTYMPPEQAEGRIDALDPRSDVYSVGALLYTLLTGRMPYVDPDKRVTAGEVLTNLLAGPPTPIAEIDHGVPPELIAICEKAMARKREDRYADMVEMAEDLRAYVERRVVRAYKTGALAEFQKWVHRNKATAAAVAALLLALVGGSVVAAWQQRKRVEEVSVAQTLTEQARTRAETSAREALANAEAARVNAERAERQSYLGNLAAAHASLRMHETREAKHLLRACPERFRGWEWRHLLFSTDTSRDVLTGHEGKVTGVAFGPEGARIASGAEDKSVRLWDATTGLLLFELPGSPDVVTALAFSPAEAKVAAASKDNLVRIWDVDAGRLTGTLTHASLPTCLAFRGDGLQLVTGTDEGAHVWDVQAFRLVRNLEHEDTVHAVAVTPDGAWIATGTDAGVLLWDPADRAPRHEIEVDEGVTCLAAAPGRVAAGSNDGTIRIIDAAAGRTVLVLAGHEDPVHAVAFAAGGARLVSASHDKTVRVWDAESGALLTVLDGHDEAVLAVGCDPAANRIVSGSADGTLRLWALEGGGGVLTLRGDEDFLSAIAFDPGGQTVAVASAGHGEIRVWEAATGKPLRYIPEAGGLSSLAFSPDGRWLAAGGEEDATGRLHDAATGRLMRTLKGHTSSVTSVAFSPDSDRLATGSADNTVRIWEVAGEAAPVVLAGGDRVGGVGFSPDGARLVVAYHDGSVAVWEAATGRRVLQLLGHEGPALAALYDPEGTRILTGGGDGLIRTWDARTGQRLGELKGHTAAVRGLAFDAAGERLLSAGHDKTVRVWDARTGDPLLRLLAHDGWVTSVAFSPDGSRIASCSFDATAKVWLTGR